MGGLQGAGNGVSERRVVFARDHDPQAWLNFLQLSRTSPPKKRTFTVLTCKTLTSSSSSSPPTLTQLSLSVGLSFASPLKLGGERQEEKMEREEEFGERWKETRAVLF
jgi:hypothetical protein